MGAVRGVLITFEGVEGSGKSTQAQLLAQYLKEKGREVVFSREPGGTEIGERIRNILLDPDCRQMDARTELFLYLASRNQHVREKILPALRAGKVVVLDRFADSSVAYQGFGRELGEKFVSRLNKLATIGLKPDITFLVDVPVVVGYQRKEKGKLDRMEQEEVKFHERVRNGYLRLARRAPGRIKVVAGEREPMEIQKEIRLLVDRMLERKGRKKV
ncbi:dTMP kinase [candidate division WOR-3 bacterium]|nr:dTMP kinase [candidate division WOR-3 bacterium]